MEAEKARRYGIRCVNSQIPLPFLLIPVQQDNINTNILPMARAEERLETITVEEACNGGIMFTAPSSSTFSAIQRNESEVSFDSVSSTERLINEPKYAKITFVNAVKQQ